MQIHRVRGNDLKDALQRARRNYGEAALVLSHERTSDGGVTLAVAQRPPAPIEVAEPAPAVQVEPPPPVKLAKPVRPRVDISTYDDVKERLQGAGFDADWTESLVRRAAAGATHDEHPMDRFGAFVGSEFGIANLKKSPGVTRVISFVGNTGVGKTTGLVKLGARLVRAQRLIGMATLDSRRVGAVEQFRAYSEMLGAPMRALRSDQVLNAEMLGIAGQDVVLLDSTGRPESDRAQLSALHKTLSSANSPAELDTFLVFPASASRAALREVTEAYGDLRLAGCVITKVDETRQPAAVIEHVLELGLPVAFLSDGQDLGRNFRRATPELLADLVLLGKIA
jgi:flagellar biosynthesis GTPase FlhF